ncbi:protein WVD2-like 7 [Camellia sinensis]|uniref:protein WVD2-like 7 n=1 Tax=Camellia sinensis TaxID=4442 RepID=UPI001036F05B|nr:protein WVD2-like 7 [Camellia sinensis]
MAGEIEEPFSFSFQADSLHSGSISFGRFEAESLSWERRSSFSHNRYLEEVEKYSKPGSVTEKKAYFEAHFKRKALLRQSSSECQTGIEYQTSENDTTENTGYREEFEHINEGSQSVQFDRSSDGSEYDGDSEVMELDKEDIGASYVEPQFEPALNVSSVVQSVSGLVNTEVAHQNQPQTQSLPVIDDEPGNEVRENLNDEVINVDLTCRDILLSTNNHTTMKDGSASSEHQLESSSKVGAPLGSKLMKPKSKCPVNVTRVQRRISSDPSKDPAKKPIRTGREVSRTIKAEKHSSQTAAPMTRSVHRTSKPEDSKNYKLQVIQDNRSSEKELNTKRVIEPKPFASKKVIPKARQTENRPKQAENSTKPGTKQSSPGLHFKCDERAERRKEFYMKMEEKMQVKEAELNQIQAKKLEKTEAEIKQFRKSLKFKATPMPSFYHEPVQRDSDNNKVCNNSATLTFCMLSSHIRHVHIEPKPFASKKVIPKARQTENRPKQAENSTKPGTKQSSPGLHFKCDERAERRKEFYMKMEEKMQAKEAELNQIQAKKLEKTEAEIKQFRKSLKFKATPMPSFYHEPVQRDSDNNKVVSSNTKSSKLRSKSTPVGGSSARSPSYAKVINDQDPFNTEKTVKTCDPPHASAATNNSLTSVPSETCASSQSPLTDKVHLTRDEINSEVTGIKEHTKETDMNLQKHRVSGCSKVPKGKRPEGKHKVEVEVEGRVHLAVGVAS